MTFAGSGYLDSLLAAAADEGGAREAVDDHAEGVPHSALSIQLTIGFQGWHPVLN